MTGWVIVSLTALAGFMVGVALGFWVSVAFAAEDAAEDGAPEGGQVRGVVDADGGDGREVDF